MTRIKSRRSDAKKGREVFEDVSEYIPTFEDVQPDASGEKPKGILAFIRGDAAKTNIVNKNKRYYPAAVFERVIGQTADAVTRGRILGQVEHPADGEDPAGSLKEAAIKFTRLYMREDVQEPGKPFFAYEGVILDTDPGHHLLNLLHAGVEVGISTRAFAKFRRGTVKEAASSGEVTIIEDMRLRGLDAVGDPSNSYGNIATHESTEDDDFTDHEEGDDDVKTTLESLRTDNPELVKELRESILADINADKDRQAAADTAIANAVLAANTAKDAEYKPLVESAGATARAEGISTAVARALAVIKGEVVEAEQTEDDKALVAALEGVVTGRIDTAVTGAVEAATKPLTESITALEGEKTTLTEKVTTLEATNGDLTKRVAELDETAKKAQDEAKQNERAALITESVKKPEFAPFAVVFRTMLESLSADVELVESVINQKAKEAENIWTAMGKPAGTGTVDTGERPGQTVTEKTEPVTAEDSPFSRLSGF
jgi:prohead core protein serine protease